MGPINYQNYYAFQITIGILAVVNGLILIIFKQGFGLKLTGVLILIIGGIFIVDSVARWNKSQIRKEKIEEFELEAKDYKIDFDILGVESEREMNWEPEKFVNGKPIGFEEFPEVNFKIEIDVFNKNFVDNIVRNIDIELIHKGKTYKSDVKVTSSNDLNKIPVTVIQRSYKKLVFHESFRYMDGTNGDILKITLVSLDNKRVTKEHKILRYKLGPNLIESII